MGGYLMTCVCIGTLKIKQKKKGKYMREEEQMNISEQILYIGVNDRAIDLFEGQYKVENGVSYNSWIILDEKIVIMDTTDKRFSATWLKNVEEALDGRLPDYLLVSHLEPDHGGNIQDIMTKYPQMTLIISSKAAAMLSQFTTQDFSERVHMVSEGETLSLGKHTLQFFMAPMVHWPEVMVTYEQTEGILFSADGFGKFGCIGTKEEWLEEARRYYINIVGKYGVPVQTLLKKASALEINQICPLHGPTLKENLSYYISFYQKWSSYEPEEKGTLLVYGSVYGNTAQAVKELACELENRGEKTVMIDLAREDMAQAVAYAFRFDKLVLASITYDAGIFPCVEDFLYHLKMKAYQNRKIGFIENGSWAPMAGKVMREQCEAMKNITICENIVTIRSALKEDNKKQLKALAEELLQ